MEELRATLARSTAEAARLEGKLETLRAQSSLDTEDRQALRILLRTARKQSAKADRVYVLFHLGELHSVHASVDAAETAAEAEGADRSGWTSCTPGAALPPAEVARRAGHSIAVLFRFYAKALHGQEQQANERIERALQAEDDAEE